jgi:hypothetical protein
VTRRHVRLPPAAAAIGATLSTILGRAAAQLSVTASGGVSFATGGSSSSSSSDGSGSGGSSSSDGSGSGGSSSGGSSSVTVLNNLDWFGPMSFLGFLRDIGKHARVGQMLAKESVRAAE